MSDDLDCPECGESMTSLPTGNEHYCQSCDVWWGWFTLRAVAVVARLRDRLPSPTPAGDSDE